MADRLSSDDDDARVTLADLEAARRRWQQVAPARWRRILDAVPFVPDERRPYDLDD
jgi:hypothetical protein